MRNQIIVKKNILLNWDANFFKIILKRLSHQNIIKCNNDKKIILNVCCKLGLEFGEKILNRLNLSIFISFMNINNCIDGAKFLYLLEYIFKFFAIGIINTRGLNKS